MHDQARNGPLHQGDTFALDRVAWVRMGTLPRLAEHLSRADTIAFDLETTGLDEHATRGGASNGGVAARIVLAALTVVTASDRPGDGSTDPVTYLLPLSHPEGEFQMRWRTVLATVATAMKESPAGLVGHNVKFDARWIYAMTGVDLTDGIVWDSQIAAHLLDENSSTRLEASSASTFGISEWGTEIDLTTPGAAERVPLILLGEYGARDTYWTWRLTMAQRFLLGREIEEWERPQDRVEVRAWRLGDFAEAVAMPTVSSLTMMEQRGFRLDAEWVNAEIFAMEGDREAAASALRARPYAPTEGTPSFAATSKWFLEWADGAVSSGDLEIIETTAKGRPRWTRSVLTKNLHRGSPVAEALLGHRHAVKRLEYLRAWTEVVSAHGTVHASYHAGRVLTGRLSSSAPNMQQITRTLKPAFIPRDGYLVAELDYSQIELRAAAFVARCGPMIAAYQRGDDLHTLMGAAVSGKAYAHVTPEDRQSAKAANFGLLYGQGAEGFRNYAEDNYGVLLTDEEAIAVVETFFDQWTGMAEWQRDSVQQAIDHGFVTSPLGRMRRLPLIHSANTWQASHAERQSMNSPVQSFASDLMQIAMADVQGLIGERVEGISVLATVHDSVIVETPIDGAEPRLLEVMGRMIRPHRHLEPLGCYLDVPLAVEATLGSRWGLDDHGTLTRSAAFDA